MADSVAGSGPYYDDLSVGMRFDAVPGMTLTEGHAAVHQAILGDRLRLSLDRHLAAEIAGPGGLLAHPGLICDVAIGQSTLATQRVIANLFYRGLQLRRIPRLGDTLRTRTEVVALRDVSLKPGRSAAGLAALRVQTVDQHERAVLDYYRCAMLPLRTGAALPGHDSDLRAIPDTVNGETLCEAIETWDLASYRERVPGPHGESLSRGARWTIETGDSVTCAPELVRLTLNLAAAHSDPHAGAGRRLVYGGHTIGIALAHLTRAIPNLVTVLAWRSCDHLAPVYEGDVLHSEVTVEEVEPRLDGPGAVAELSVRTTAVRGDTGRTDAVLDWRPIGAMA